MSDDARGELVSPSSVVPEPPSPVDGPLPPVTFGRRAILQSLAGGVGAAVVAAPAAAHVHQAAAPAAQPARPVRRAAATAAPALVFLDRHAFETLTALADQIVPGAKAAKVPEVIDRILSVESSDTQRRFLEAIGAFEQQARAAHGKPWKALTAVQANALLTKMSGAAGSESARRAFDVVKSGVAETYFATREGMKDLGWNGSVMFAPPAACG
jgi:hypothetical protein